MVEAQFTSWQAYLVAKAKMPRFSCQHCNHWRPQDPSGHSQCALVASTDSPANGAIEPVMTCALWRAGPARITTTTILRGRGASSHGLAPGNARYWMEQAFVPPPRTKPPSEVQRHLVMLNAMGRT